MDFSPNLQKLRHGYLAGAFRRLLYTCLIGRTEWPPTFRAPQGTEVKLGASRNVYIHLPFCETLCPHCPYNKVHFEPDAAWAYQNALVREIANYVDRPDALPVDTLYFGGGTPTLTLGTLRSVVGALRPLLSQSAELAVEAYPTHATSEILGELRAIGINRISLGIESLDPILLKRLGRRYSPEIALKALETSKAAGFDMVDANLIFGIPDQSVDAFLAGVEDCLAASVDQVSAYPLFTFDHTPAGQGQHAKLFAKANDLRRLAMQRGVSRLCRSSGFERTSVWSFTRKGLSPYTTVTRPDYVGFGAGAGSKSTALVAFNTFSVPAYVDASPYATALVHELSDRQQKVDWLYWQIYNTRIDGRAYAARFGQSLEQDFGTLLRILRSLGLIERINSDDVLTEAGAIWVHRVQSLFSLRGIDAVWTACQREPWPNSVELA